MIDIEKKGIYCHSQCQFPLCFFAVCVEYFFEVPDVLRDLKPDIYATLCAMLNQDPLNYQNDYKLQKPGAKVSMVSIGDRAIDV